MSLTNVTFSLCFTDGSRQVNITKQLKLSTKIKTIAEDIKKNFNAQELKVFYRGQSVDENKPLSFYRLPENDVIQIFVQESCKSQPSASTIPLYTNSEAVDVTDSGLLQPEAMDVTDSGLLQPSTSTASSTNNHKDEGAETVCPLYQVGDIVDFMEPETDAYFEGRILKILTYSDHEKLHFEIEHMRFISSRYLLTLDEFRPVAQEKIAKENLKADSTVLANYNLDEPSRIGYWYPFLVECVSPLTGSIIKGVSTIPGCSPVLDILYKIEDHCANPHLKSLPDTSLRLTNYLCAICEDKEDAKCESCGCCVCLSKQGSWRIVLCDDCNNGYHINCLPTKLWTIPEGDWYCDDCRRVPRNGNTKLFGEVGVEVGTTWATRQEVSSSGVHKPIRALVDYDHKGLYSILATQKNVHLDQGNSIIFKCSVCSSVDKSEELKKMQTLEDRLPTWSKKLILNYDPHATAYLAGGILENWKKGKAVRLVRTSNPNSLYSPNAGFRYDGPYCLQKFEAIHISKECAIWLFTLKRNDTSITAPWTKKGQLLVKRMAEKKLSTKNVYTKQVQHHMKRDYANHDLWEILLLELTKGDHIFINEVRQAFKCPICLDTVVNPVTTDCKHNFCLKCFEELLKDSDVCPVCRKEITSENFDKNKSLKKLLELIL